MARIRTIKPEFFKHEELHHLELETGLPVRLAFVGLWTQCDREGRFRWQPRVLKTDILPFDDCDFSLVLDALHAGGFIQKYEAGGKWYGCVPTFHSHQTVNHREAESKIPEPPTLTETTRDDASSSLHGNARACPGGTGTGRELERKGKEDSDNADASSSVAVATTPVAPVVVSASQQEVVDAWNKVASEEGFVTARQLTSDRQRALKARLADPHWDWRQALERIRGSPFCHGHNPRNWRATFDFFIKPKTVNALLEGQYIDDPPPDSENPFV